MTHDAPIDDCWHTIGVTGDHSCPLLPEHVDCRNCPVFSAAATRLNGLLPDDHLATWARHFALPKVDATRGAQSVVAFRLFAEWFGLATSVFNEVIEPRTIHSLPHRRGGVVLGLLNVRGELLIAVALDKLLGLEALAGQEVRGRSAAPKRLVVVAWRARRLVFPVDEVHGILRFDAMALRDAPSTVARADVSYTRAVLPWEERSVSLLHEGRLFDALDRSLA